MRACLAPSFPGTDVPDWIRRFLAGGGGAIVLFSYNVRDRAQLKRLTSELQRERGDVLLAIDEEGGDVTRLYADEGSSTPGNAALGHIDDVALTEAVAREIGADLAAVGVNWNLAPVADVNVPANPVIGVRSFGDDSSLVARHVAAYVRGVQSAGVAACAKHFPGHGSTEQDSHLELPVLVGDVEAGLEPFRSAIAAGVKTVMTAHLRVPGFGDDPATVNPALIGMLRDDLGFDGVVMADALEMKGLSASVGVEEGAVRALAAGVDSLCVGHDLHEEAVDAIEEAVLAAISSGRLPEERVAEAANRVRRVAVTTFTERRPGVGLEAARRAIEATGAVQAEGATVVELVPAANIAAGEHVHGFDGARFVREGDDVPAAGVYVVRDAHRHQWMRDAADREGVVVVEVGLPVWKPVHARGYLATYGRSRVSLTAAAERLGL